MTTAETEVFVLREVVAASYESDYPSHVASAHGLVG